MAKSIFHSKIARNAVFAGFLTFVVAAAPKVGELLEGRYPNQAKEIGFVVDLIAIAGSVGGIGTASTIIGARVGKGDLYTPSGLPGPDFKDM